MSFTVQLTPAARRQLRRLRDPIRTRIITALSALEEDPRPNGVVKLSGANDRWRVRVGDYRIVFRIENDNHIVIVLVIAHRRDVYR